jgi:dTDP-4-dehydrorhamnose reductase
MKVLVTGAAGLLGTAVWHVFSEDHDLFALGRTHPVHVPETQWRECDLRDASQTYKTVTRVNPDLIVHCASYNDVDGAEANPDEAFRVNALGPRNLALACQRFDTVLMAISTDYVFDGTTAPAEGYREIDPARPISLYGHSKRWGEKMVEQLLHKFYIVRTSWLFGPARASYVDKVVEWARKGEPVPCIEDMRSAPTFTPDLARALKQLGESGLYGLYHLTNSGYCSRVDLAREVLQLHKLPEKWLKPMTQSQFKHAARRPEFSGLRNYAWHLNGFPPLRPWQEALRDHFSAALTPPKRS